MTTPEVLGERYEIGGVLGRGGMAEVHRGRDLRLGREVAVKVLRNDLARDPSFQVRFRREAQASASLNHPAIVAVYDTGEDRTPSGNTPYIVMEYVEGETLRDVLRRDGVLPIEKAMSLSADICGALDFSHRNGIVHRDVKPGNVMITPQGTVKVMDFGIARAVSDSAATMTSTAAVIGTAQYLSPEQARGESVDARSDVYSMGCLLYELVTGAPPFTGDSPVSVAYQHVREDPRLPSSIRREIPPELDSILLKAMSKNPANRYQSAAEMRNDLLRALAGQQVEATPVLSEAERTAVIGVAPTAGARRAERDDWDDDADRRRKRNRVIALVVAAVVLVAAVVVGAVLINNNKGDDDTTAGTAQVTVPPNLKNMTVADATAAIEGAGLKVAASTKSVEVEDETQIGTVRDTDPASGAKVDKGSEVTLTVGVGPDTIPVPNVIGSGVDEAQTQLADFAGVDTAQGDSLDDAGTVIKVVPSVGTRVSPDTRIALTVSTGTLAIPDLGGQTDPSAVIASLKGLGFSVNGAPAQVNADQPAGAVVGTDPAVGTKVDASTPITVQVSKGPAQQTVPVPNVLDQKQAAAASALQALGLVVKVETQPGDVGDVGNVVDQTPSGGSQVAKGSTVTITVGTDAGGTSTSPSTATTTPSGG